jgi:hypothetical protein
MTIRPFTSVRMTCAGCRVQQWISFRLQRSAGYKDRCVPMRFAKPFHDDGGQHTHIISLRFFNTVASACRPLNISTADDYGTSILSQRWILFLWHRRVAADGCHGTDPHQGLAAKFEKYSFKWSHVGSDI